MATMNQETKAAKKALKDAGIAVTSCKHGTGSVYGWIYVVIDGPYDKALETKAYQIVKVASGRENRHDDGMTDYYCENISIEFTRRGGISYADECKQNRIAYGIEEA